MSYIEGFVVPVPEAKQEAYRRHASEAAAMFHDLGATRLVEAWGDDVPDGKVTDFRRSVKAEPGEAVVFSWLEYPSKAVRDEANVRMREDPRMKAMMSADMPFDAQRMIYGGFEVVFEQGEGSGGYVDGSLLAVPSSSRDACEAHMELFSKVLAEKGALRQVRAYADDVPDGKVTDFKRAVAAASEETVVFMWMEWPDRAARDAGWGAAMSDPRMAPPAEGLPYDGKRQVYGGFRTIVDA